MAGRGFIHDKLEIKFLILYIAARVIEPVPFDVVLDLTMCDDAIDYFDFSECLADLVKTEHLTLSEEGLYAITEKGLKNSQICETSLPYSVRLRCDKNLADCNRRLPYIFPESRNHCPELSPTQPTETQAQYYPPYFFHQKVKF